MHALQVGPSMTSTIENAIEGFVDSAVIMRPQSHFTKRVHPRMHGGRHQHAAQIPKPLVDLTNLSLKLTSQSHQVRFRRCGFQFNNMQHQFIRPGDRSSIDFRFDPSTFCFDQAVANRQNIQTVFGDNHVFQFNAISFKQSKFLFCGLCHDCDVPV